MSIPWKHLNYWSTGEWQVVDERLKDLTKRGTLWNPGRSQLFRALSEVPSDKVKVLIVGQDPYPDPKYSCGFAFSSGGPLIPRSLASLFGDLQGDYPGIDLQSGDLSVWASRGVLLWNAYPSCTAWLSGSHHWYEYEPLTHEIVKTCSDKGIVCAFLGGLARKFSEQMNDNESFAIYAPHPAARNDLFKKADPHLFRTINLRLKDLGEPEIDWSIK